METNIDQEEKVNKKRYQLMYEDHKPLIIPQLEIYDAESCKKYLALNNYVEKQMNAKYKLQKEKRDLKLQIKWNRDDN